MYKKMKKIDKEMNTISFEPFLKNKINFIVFIFLYKGIFCYFNNFDTCNFNINSTDLSEFVTDPTVYKEVGESFTVVCPFVKSNFTSIEDAFKFDGTSDHILYESFKVYDGDLIALKIRSWKPAKFYLSCRSQKEKKCLKEIIIGYPPLNVDKFRCFSFNWEVLECSYDLKPNPSQRKQDDYFLSYTIGHKRVDGYRCISNEVVRCCNSSGQECWKWDNSGDFLYDVTEQYLNLTLVSSNPLGRRKYNYVVNQYEIMLPDPVTELKTELKGPSNVRVSFKLPKFLAFFPAGITYRVIIEGCGTNTQIVGKTYKKKNIVEKFEKTLNKGQKYIFTVQIRSGNLSEKIESEDWWSKPVTSVLTTLSSPPKVAPLTTHGGFHISNTESTNKTVSIFWEDIDNCSKNGQGFGYQIDVFSDGRRIEALPNKMTNFYAIFENLITSDADLTFVVRPTNEAGLSTNFSTIEVKKTHPLISDLRFFIAIFYPQNNTIYFRWFGENLQDNNYTLYWCQELLTYNRKEVVPCKDSISWKNLTSFGERNNFAPENEIQNLRFGLSSERQVKGEIYSSGVIWSSCPLLQYTTEGDVVPPILTVDAISSTSIVVTWDIHCNSWKGNPLSIEIIWCTETHNLTLTCKASIKVLQELFPNSYEVQDLKPDQSYSLWSRILFSTSKSEYNSPIHFRTRKKILSTMNIVLVSSATVVGIFFILLLMFYSPRKIMKIWINAKQKVNLPKGIFDPTQNQFEKKEKKMPPTNHSKTKPNLKPKRLDSILTHQGISAKKGSVTSESIKSFTRGSNPQNHTRETEIFLKCLQNTCKDFYTHHYHASFCGSNLETGIYETTHSYCQLPFNLGTKILSNGYVSTSLPTLHVNNINDKLTNKLPKENTIENRPYCKLSLNFTPPPDGYVSAISPVLPTLRHNNTEKEANETSKLIDESREPFEMINKKEQEYIWQYHFLKQLNFHLRNDKHVDELDTLSNESVKNTIQENIYHELPSHFEFQPPPDGYVSAIMPTSSTNIFNEGVEIEEIKEIGETYKAIDTNDTNRLCSEFLQYSKYNPPLDGYVSATLPFLTTDIVNEIKESEEASKSIDIKNTHYLCNEFPSSSKYKTPLTGYGSTILPSLTTANEGVRIEEIKESEETSKSTDFRDTDHLYSELPLLSKFKPASNGYVSVTLPSLKTNIANEGLKVKEIEENEVASKPIDIQNSESLQSSKFKPPSNGYVSAILPSLPTNIANKDTKTEKIKGSETVSKSIAIIDTNLNFNELLQSSNLKPPPNGYVSAILPAVNSIEEKSEESTQLKMSQNFETKYVTCPQLFGQSFSRNFPKIADDNDDNISFCFPDVYEDTDNSYLTQNFDFTLDSMSKNSQNFIENEYSNATPQFKFQHVQSHEYESGKFQNENQNEETYRSAEPKFGYSFLNSLIPVDDEKQNIRNYTLETIKRSNENISNIQFSSEIKYSEPIKSNESIKLFSLGNEKESKHEHVCLSNFY